MKFIFRGNTIFEYIPEKQEVIQNQIHEVIPAFDYCRMIPEDYKLLGEFFNRVYRHTQGEEILLEDIKVN